MDQPRVINDIVLPLLGLAREAEIRARHWSDAEVERLLAERCGGRWKRDERRDCFLRLDDYSARSASSAVTAS
jgi:hypothetical protein